MVYGQQFQKQLQEKEREFSTISRFVVNNSMNSLALRKRSLGFRVAEQRVNGLRQSHLVHIITNLLFAAARLDQDGKVPDFMGYFM